MSCGDLYLKGKLYLCRGLLVASQAAEGQGISCVLRSGFRYSSCVRLLRKNREARVPNRILSTLVRCMSAALKRGSNWARAGQFSNPSVSTLWYSTLHLHAEMSSDHTTSRQLSAYVLHTEQKKYLETYLERLSHSFNIPTLQFYAFQLYVF